MKLYAVKFTGRCAMEVQVLHAASLEAATKMANEYLKDNNEVYMSMNITALPEDGEEGCVFNADYIELVRLAHRARYLKGYLAFFAFDSGLV